MRFFALLLISIFSFSLIKPPAATSGEEWVQEISLLYQTQTAAHFLAHLDSKYEEELQKEITDPEKAIPIPSFTKISTSDLSPEHQKLLQEIMEEKIAGLQAIEARYPDHPLVKLIPLRIERERLSVEEKFYFSTLHDGIGPVPLFLKAWYKELFLKLYFANDSQYTCHPFTEETAYFLVHLQMNEKLDQILQENSDAPDASIFRKFLDSYEKDETITFDFRPLEHLEKETYLPQDSCEEEIQELFISIRIKLEKMILDLWANNNL